MPYPADLDEAKKLWRERLRFEYLQELLGKIGARKKNLAAASRVSRRRPKRMPQIAAPTPASPEPGALGARSPKGGELPACGCREERAASGGCASRATRARRRSASPRPPKKTDDEEIVETLSHRYHRNLRFFTDWNNDDVLQIYLTALAHVYDPHSDYLGRAQLEQFSIGMNLSLFGIGAELAFGGRLLQDSPAAARRAGDQEQADQGE